jgi:hypothetical protein
MRTTRRTTTNYSGGTTTTYCPRLPRHRRPLPEPPAWSRTCADTAIDPPSCRIGRSQGERGQSVHPLAAKAESVSKSVGRANKRAQSRAEARA